MDDVDTSGGINITSSSSSSSPSSWSSMMVVDELNVSSCNLTMDDVNSTWLKDVTDMATLIDRSVTPIWYIVGIAGNIVSAQIWLRRRMRRNNSSAVYLATLSINDTLFLLLHILQELKYAWSQRTVDYPVVCESFAFVYLVTQYLAPTLVLGFTVERFIAVCYPYQKNTFCTARRALKVVLSMIAGCLTLGSMQLYLWKYDAENEKCVVRSEAEPDNPASLWSVWSWTTEMLIFLVVPVIILFINILVMREVCRMSNPMVEAAAKPHKHKASKSTATNAMLLSVSFYVIFTTLPATLVYVLHSAFPEGNACLPDIAADATWRSYASYTIVRKLVDEVCLSHYACNFFLFVITGLEFRLELCRTFRRLVRSGSFPRAMHENGHSEINSRMYKNSLKSADELHTCISKM